MNLRRRPPRRSRPGLDWLETRNLLSGSTSSLPGMLGAGPLPPSDLPEPTDEFGITAVSPSLVATGGDTGTGLAESPSTIAITFNQPISADVLPAGISPVFLYRVVDGQPTDSIFDVSPPISVSFEDGETRLVITMDPSQPLSPGTYRLVIPAGMPIVSTDFTPLPGFDSDIVLGDFAIAQPEAAIGRSQAIDLGTILPGPIQVSGSLDLITRPHDVVLYRIQIPSNIEQSLWRLGLEVHATDGSNLQTGLTLFDAQGRPVAGTTVGRPSSPGGPYLFAGVEPGATYYVGVSSFANMPGQPGGYEIESEAGTHGSNAEGQTGGGFVIGLVADPIDEPTRILTFDLNHADPTDPTPSGFTIGFDGAVEPGTGHGPAASSPLKLLDSHGQIHDLTLASFDETNARLSFLFPTRLPAGSYSVIVPGSGGLADLIGRSPVADGLPEGVLARFDVAESPAPSGLNLGVIYPGDDSRPPSPALAIEPGATADIRFVAATPGAYHFATPATGTGLSIELVAPDGASRYLDSSMVTGVGGLSLVLTSPGVYHLRITSAGAGTIGIGLAVSGQKTDADSLIRSGIGQGPALDLRLISPQAPSIGSNSTTTPTPTTPTPPLSTPTGTASTPGFTNPAGPDPSSFSGRDQGRTESLSTASVMGESLTATPPTNSIPLVGLGGQLVGRPDSRADRVATVANVAPAGSNGLAANQALLPLAMILDPSRGRVNRPSESAEPDVSDGFKNGAMVDRRGARSPGDAVENAEEIAAEAAAPGTDWVDRALAAIGNLIAPDRSAPDLPTVDEHLMAEISQISGNSEEAAESTRPRHQIGLAEPIGLTLLIATLTQQGRRALRRREAEQSRKSSKSKPTPAPRPHHGRLSIGRVVGSPRSPSRSR